VDVSVYDLYFNVNPPQRCRGQVGQKIPGVVRCINSYEFREVLPEYRNVSNGDYAGCDELQKYDQKQRKVPPLHYKIFLFFSPSVEKSD
jgi:hypothetical protein